MLVVSLRVIQVLSQFRVISSGAPEDAGPRRVPALNDGPAAADETRALLDRLQPSLPILMTI